MSSSAEIASLAMQAGRLASTGDWQAAERVWRQVIAIDPKHPDGLYALSMHALQRGDHAEAAALIATARAAGGDKPHYAIAAANIHRAAGDTTAELQALEAALVLDPYHLAALLGKAFWFERAGLLKAAARLFTDSLEVAPPEPLWPDNLRAELAHARLRAGQYAEAVETILHAAVGSTINRMGGTRGERWRETVSIMAGRTKPYFSNCNQLHVPRLPAIPFYDRQQFSWVDRLEDRTEAIAAELASVMVDDAGSFRPYIAYKPGEPVAQWSQLNHSNRWSSYPFYAQGKPVEEHLARCPVTAEALAGVELADIEALCPNVMFSVLAPQTSIPPHYGETNARLVAHLPLVVPPGCSYQVGYEHRHWRVGETLIFDDTLLHSAHNRSDQPRVVLIFDVWNPLLSLEERELVRTLTSSMAAFNRE